MGVCKYLFHVHSILNSNMLYFICNVKLLSLRWLAKFIAHFNGYYVCVYIYIYIYNFCTILCKWFVNVASNRIPIPPPASLPRTLPIGSGSTLRLVPSSSSWALLESSWNVMAHDDARKGKWRGNWRMEWVASTLHATSEHGVSSITTADAHTSAASSRLKWSPRRFKWTRPFRRKTKSCFCACAITFQTQSTA